MLSRIMRTRSSDEIGLDEIFVGPFVSRIRQPVLAGARVSVLESFLVILCQVMDI